MKKSINTRFSKAAKFIIYKEKGYDESKMASILGIKSNKFSEILKEKADVSPKIISLFCFHYDISMEWIMLGNGNMLKSEVVVMLNENSKLLKESIDLLKQQIELQDTIATLRMENQRLMEERGNNRHS